MQSETLTWLIPVPPLISFFLIWIFSNRSKTLSHTIAISATIISWIFSLIVLLTAIVTPHFGEFVFAQGINWLPTGNTFFTMGVLVDPLTVAMLIFVPLAIFLIFFYSVGYHNYGKRLDPHDAANPGSPAHHGIEP